MFINTVPKPNEQISDNIFMLQKRPTYKNIKTIFTRFLK